MRRRNKGLSFYRKKKKISAGTVREIFVYIFGICVAVFLAFILVYSVGMSVSVIGVSMEPEFTNGQKVLVNRYAYLLTSPKQNDVVVIVEVRTRRNNHFGDTEMTIDRQKIRNICIASNAFVKRLRIDNEIRFDIIAITGTPEIGYTINHIEDALKPHLSWW